MNSHPLFECSNISFERDDVPLFSGVNFQIHSSQAIQVIGANGAGKTTLLRIIAGSLTATAGDMFWRGKNIHSARGQFREQMLYLGHNAGIKPSLTPRENLQWYFQLFPGSLESIDDALLKVSLEGYEDVSCHALSAGQQRRVGLARLYLTSALVWILDEPFTSIDVQGVAALETLMASHLSRGGSIIMTSHQASALKGVELIDLEKFAVVH